MKQFRTSLLKFLSTYDDWELLKTSFFETPFQVYYSKKYNIHLHLIECDERLGSVDPNFFQNISLTCIKDKQKLIHLREEWWIEKKEFIQYRLTSLFDMNVKVHGRQCSVKRIEKKEYDDFLNRNHLNQTAKTRYKYGLYKKETLLAVMGISAGRMMKFEEDPRKSFEIIRFSTEQNCTVVGGFTKLLSFIEKELDVEEWMSYFDLDWVVSNVYLSANFKIKEYTKPQKVHLNFNNTDTYTSGNLKLIRKNER